MKVMDVIDRVDMMEPNAFSPEQKLRWLSTLDGKVFTEVILTHEGGKLDALPDYQTGQEELLIPRPYGEDIYHNYLMAMMDAENNETQRYNRRMTMFNSLYQEFTNWYNRTHRPKTTGKQFI